MPGLANSVFLSQGCWTSPGSNMRRPVSCVEEAAPTNHKAAKLAFSSWGMQKPRPPSMAEFQPDEPCRVLAIISVRPMTDGPLGYSSSEGRWQMGSKCSSASLNNSYCGEGI